MHFIVLFTLFSVLTPALIIHEKVVFHKASEVALTRSKWLSTCIIYLNPYGNFINKLSKDLGKARITAHSIDQSYDFPSEQDYSRIIKGLKGYILALVNDQHTLVENYIELHAIHTKVKRSLVPLIVMGLSYLFGTATESDLNSICSSVSRLSKFQGQIFHVID